MAILTQNLPYITKELAFAKFERLFLFVDVAPNSPCLLPFLKDNKKFCHFLACSVDALSKKKKKSTYLMSKSMVREFKINCLVKKLVSRKL